jgi:predicted dehydrogenase
MGTTSTLRIGTNRRSPDLERLTVRGLLVELPVDHIERHRTAYLAEMRHFIGSVRSARPSGVGGDDALAALDLALAAERSFVEGRPVRL